MCVRYAGVDPRQERREERLHERFGEGQWTDLFPGERGSFAKEGGELVEATWGLQPHWAKDAHFGKRNAYNARSETIHEKPTFRTAFKHRRCLVPAAAFYERAGEKGKMHWLRILPQHDETFLIAALWEPENEWTHGLPTYTLVTTEPNALVAQAHDRMPVMLSSEDAEVWTDPKTEPGELRALMAPCPPEWTSLEDAGPVAKGKAKPAGETLL